MWDEIQMLNKYFSLSLLKIDKTKMTIFKTGRHIEPFDRAQGKFSRNVLIIKDNYLSTPLEMTEELIF